MRVKEPYMDNSVRGGTVDQGTNVKLSCDTPGARIYYTMDGSPAELHIDSVKVIINGNLVEDIQISESITILIVLMFHLVITKVKPDDF